MSAAMSDDSESGGEENCTRDNEGNDSPKSESLSRSSSPAPQSPSPPQSPASPRTPASPDEEAVQESPHSSPRSPPSSPRSSSDRKSSPSSPQSRSSPQQSPSSANGDQSDEEAQASDVEMSDAENRDSEDESAVKEDERDEAKKSENEGSDHSEAEESEQENIPEVNIESADENEEEKQSDKENDSDNEVERSGDEGKDGQSSVHVGSDVENKSDDEDESPGNDRVKSDSPHSSPTSPIQTEEKAGASGIEDAEKSNKNESDAEDNAESESDGESDESEVGGLIADIFGESDDDEEFEGFNEDDIGGEKGSKEGSAKPKKKRAKIMSDSEDEKDEQEKEENAESAGIIEDLPAPPAEEGEIQDDEPPPKKKKVDESDSEDEDRKMREDFVSDFDLMMQKKKEESSKRRRRRDVDLISDSDDLIADIILQMRQAAEEDKILNEQKKTATKKLKILPMVMSQLKKQDLKTAFLDQGVLNVIAEWLTPLPDRSLPHLNIREGMLKQLSDLPSFDQSLLKASGIGRALMYLYKHPKETKENRAKAGKLITEWARPIFNVTTNYHSLTKEEREQRDYDHIPKQGKRKDRSSSQDEEESNERKDIDKEMLNEKSAIRPGDKGWIGRARVPMPSTKDYVNRPKWNVEMEFGRGPSKKPLNRIEKHMRSLQDKKRLSKQQRAITISIEGRKMAI